MGVKVFGCFCSLKRKHVLEREFIGQFFLIGFVFGIKLVEISVCLCGVWNLQERPKMSAEPATTTLAQRFARFLANSVFLPTRIDYGAILSRPLRWLTIFCFLTLLVLALPPVMEFIIVKFLDDEFIKNVAANQKDYKIWLSYVSFTLEIIVLLTLGGTIFGEWITAKSKDALKEYQEQLEKARTQRIGELREGLQDHILSITNAVQGAKWRNLLQTVLTISRASVSVYDILLNQVPIANRTFLMAKLYVSFPGGLYGLLSFLTIILLTITKAVQLYVEQIGQRGGP